MNFRKLFYGHTGFSSFCLYRYMYYIFQQWCILQRAHFLDGCLLKGIRLNPSRSKSVWSIAKCKAYFTVFMVLLLLALSFTLHLKMKVCIICSWQGCFFFSCQWNESIALSTFASSFQKFRKSQDESWVMLTDCNCRFSTCAILGTIIFSMDSF